MKKIYLAILLGVLPLLGFAQQKNSYNVSTELQKKNVLLEEFTGVKCKYCPQGHKMAEDLKFIFGDKLNVISIHYGNLSYMQGYDYTTAAGNEIGDILGAANQGFPNGSINRHNWNGPGDGQYSFNRYSWAGRANQTVQEDAPVNLWAEAEYDASTKNMNIRVEGYFTGMDIKSSQRLSVLVLQNDVVGIQNDGGSYDYSYVHNHMLRDAVNGALGEVLDNCTQGSYFVKDYTYNVPERIGDADVDPVALEIAVLVTEEDGRHVQNSIIVKPSYPGQTLELKASLKSDLKGVTDGYQFNFLPVAVTNKSNIVLTSADFDITFNQNTVKHQWTGEIGAFATQIINLPIDWSNVQEYGNSYSVVVKKLNGKDVDNSSLTGSIDCPNYITDASDVIMKITTCIDIEDFNYRLLDMDGNVVKEFGPYQGDVQYEENLSLEGETKYCMEIESKWGNGYYPETDVLQLCNKDGSVVTGIAQHKGFATRLFFKTGPGAKKEKKMLTVTAGNGGTVLVGGDELRDTTKEFEYDPDEEVTLSIVPDNGYKVKSVMVNGNDMTSAIKENNLVIKMDGNYKVDVQFEMIKFDVSVSVTKGGSVEILSETVTEGIKEFQCVTGQKIEFTVIPDEGFNVKSVLVNGEDVKSSLTDGSYTVVIKEALNIEVSFDETSGISDVTLSDDISPVYDLNGCRADKIIKGHVYIKNGKKFVAE